MAKKTPKTNSKPDDDPGCFLDKLPPERQQWILSQMNMDAFVEPMRKLRKQLESEANEAATDTPGQSEVGL